MKNIAILPVVVILCLGTAAAVGAAAEGKLPKVIVLGAVSKVYEPVKFDHEKHVSLADGCGGCHHQHRSMKVDDCKDCHRFDPASFRKNLMADRLLPCRDCHPRAENPGISGVLGLRSAYHNACNKCHWGEVGSKNLGGCAEVCHVAKAPAKQGAGK